LISGIDFIGRAERGWRGFGEEVRAQAQGLLVVFTQGIGFFLSSQLLVRHLGSRYGVPGDDAGSWQSYWLVPAMFMAGVLVLFWFAFREERRGEENRLKSFQIMK
jgi:hypothetical protein